MSTMSEEAFLKKLRAEFLAGVGQELDVWEANLLAYDQSGDIENLAELKRLVHSMKSTTLSLELNEIGTLLHEFERWMLAREKVKPRSEIVSFGLSFIDDLRRCFSALWSGQDSSSIAEKMRSCLD